MKDLIFAEHRCPRGSRLVPPENSSPLIALAFFPSDDLLTSVCSSLHCSVGVSFISRFFQIGQIDGETPLTMKEFVRFLFSAVSSTVRSKLTLQMEIAALRHQLSVYQRTCHRPRVTPADRILWSCGQKIHPLSSKAWRGPKTKWSGDPVYSDSLRVRIILDQYRNWLRMLRIPNIATASSCPEKVQDQYAPSQNRSRLSATSAKKSRKTQ